MVFYQVQNIKDINFKKIFDDYHQHFSGRNVIFTTNYRLIKEFEVRFNDNDLPHLMGWHKVTYKNRSASYIINLVKKQKMTFNNTRKHQDFHKIKSRILNYNFLHEIFYQFNPNVCVMTSDMHPNPLCLDIVFFKQNKPREIVILGLRRERKLHYFVPTTLHTESSHHNQYLLRRRTKVIQIQWTK